MTTETVTDSMTHAAAMLTAKTVMNTTGAARQFLTPRLALHARPLSDARADFQALSLELARESEKRGA